MHETLQTAAEATGQPMASPPVRLASSVLTSPILCTLRHAMTDPPPTSERTSSAGQVSVNTGPVASPLRTGTNAAAALWDMESPTDATEKVRCVLLCCL